METIRESVNNASKKIDELITSTPEVIKGTVKNVNQGTETVKTNISNTFSDFSNFNMKAPLEFLQSNTIIAKFSVLILVIIGFVFLLYLGISLLQYLASPPSNPYVIHGMIDGGTQKNINQDPNATGSVYIERSNNQLNGIEYTWSVWLYVSKINTSQSIGTYSHIFNKGDTIHWDTDGISLMNNGPGLYLSNADNSLLVVCDTVNYTTGNRNVDSAKIDIPNIPMNKWFHIGIRMKNTVLDVYMNGIIANRKVLPYLPKLNYGTVNICNGNGITNGFQGSLSNLRYFNTALNVFDINSIVAAGPSLKSLDSPSSSNSGYNYLSNMWYSYNQYQ
jgi:hypothetical protein